ncbi:vomeronasal type-2 receptor 26-like [Ambystoma mexicanum]|uniref:vomeronasal type-2 receptor 26-like n=1 Tax=Ambystoma mexicanum TaxID=8296 RepID=UPI0037E86CA7
MAAPLSHPLRLLTFNRLYSGSEELTTLLIPQSSCSEMCTAGFRKSTRDGQGVCCYDCIQCSEGEISNQTVALPYVQLQHGLLQISEIQIPTLKSGISLALTQYLSKPIKSELLTPAIAQQSPSNDGVERYLAAVEETGEAYSNRSDSPDCIKCPDDQWSNVNRDRCIPKSIEFLSFQEPLGYTLATVTTASASVPIAILVIFFKHRETPIVKANNRRLSCLLLVALSLCLLSTFLFLGRPTNITCLLRQVTFSILFVMSVSCLLAKTILVLMAFNATHPGTNLKSGLGPRIPALIVIACTLVQTVICVVWLASFPPYAEQNMKSLIGKVVVECNEGSPTAFWCVLGYMGLLAFASFLVAFRARKLPDSFNEAQLITFSMVTFLTVWTLFLPAYQNTRGKYMVAVEVFTIISSSLGIVVCIFCPKCYIILIQPDLNSRNYLKGK